MLIIQLVSVSLVLPLSLSSPTPGLLSPVSHHHTSQRAFSEPVPPGASAPLSLSSIDFMSLEGLCLQLCSFSIKFVCFLLATYWSTLYFRDINICLLFVMQIFYHLFLTLFLSGYKPWTRISRSYDNSIFSFLGYLLTVSIMAAPIYIPTSNMRKFPFLPTFSPIYYL